VSHQLFFILIIKRGMEDGDLLKSVITLLDFNEKFVFQVVSAIRVQMVQC
jgi:hypothetical protein